MTVPFASSPIANRQMIQRYLAIFGNLELETEVRSKAFWIAQDMIYKGTDQLLHKNPWAEKAVWEMCEQRFIGFSGCASSGKSTIAGRFGVMFWWANPKRTKLMVTSTDKQGAKNRIWAQIRESFQAGQQRWGLPGRLIESMSIIVLDLEEGVASARSGIELYAGEPKKSAECIQKWIGIKNQRVMLILDEMPYLGPQLLTAAYSNLIANPYFQLIGLGNFASKLDPFGQFLTPRRGWDTITIDDDEWETICNGIPGKCIRFDGSKSPNVLAGENLYSEIYSVELFEKHKLIGENHPRFWQMCRSFPAPVGIGNNIYSEAHFDFNKQSEPIWMSIPVHVAALDPAFTNGGDRTQMITGKFGTIEGGRKHLHITGYEELYADASKASETRDYQIARAFRDRCKRRGILPINTALDATGAGSPFHSIVVTEWAQGVERVEFGGAASERPAHENDGRPGNEVYFNRSAELWDQGKEYLVRGMITGISRELAAELCAREYDQLGVQKIKIESKKVMKQRIGKSPDLADAFLILLDLCRSRFSLFPTEVGHDAGAKRVPTGDGGYYQRLASLNDNVNVRENVSEPTPPFDKTQPLIGWQVDGIQDLYGSDLERFIDWGTGS